MGRMSMNFKKWKLYIYSIFTCVGLLIAGYFFVIKPYFLRKPAEQTLAIIKPDAVAAKVTGKIIEKIEQAGFKIIDLRKIQLEKEGAEKFYIEHKEKKFFTDLVTFMTSSPIIVMILEKDNAVQSWRKLMGTTDPAKAEEGTLRKLFATSVEKNAVHGSDSLEAAAREIKFFFSEAL